MRKFWYGLNYRWCMVNAYLAQDHAPILSAQYQRYADHWQLELWKLDRGFV
jgi:hypothetical protein